MKKYAVIFIIILAVIATSLPSCSKKSSFADDVPCDKISKAAHDAVDSTQEYGEHTADYIRLYFDEGFDSASVTYSLNTNDINEIGVFHGESEEQAKEIEEACREYLRDIREEQRAFIASYAPEELPKLDGAQVRRYGNYVIYAILPTEMLPQAFDAAESALLSGK